MRKTETLEPKIPDTFLLEIVKSGGFRDSDETGQLAAGYILKQANIQFQFVPDLYTVIAEETFTVDEDIDYSTEGRSTDKNWFGKRI